MDRIAVYSWVNDNTIPYYKQGNTLMFKKSEIDKWLLRTRVKDNTELMEEAQRYGNGDFWTKKRKYKDRTDVSFTKDQGED